MNIQILQLTEGAKKARGIAVIIDVFRAFSVEAYMFSMGAEKIIPIGDADIAYKLKAENPEYILAGERHGKILPGFDVGNSPTDISKMQIKGKTAVHTTSAGTQGIANAKNAEVILGASLVNARATAEYIRKSGICDISLVCMGLEALAPTEEDTLCAQYIRSILLGEEFDIAPKIEELKLTSGAKFFDKAQNDVFPETDFFLCTQTDKFDFAMRLTRGEDGIDFMQMCR
ncbi:MAG: 2-phosphosulfolactate phosphatase [Clostridia bacterium]|nr:2-phosphosulfolactate phosphatase [Clostridia bacterium]